MLCVGFLSSGDIFYEMAFSTTSSIFGYKESYELLWSFVATNHVMSLLIYPRANCQLKRLERETAYPYDVPPVMFFIEFREQEHFCDEPGCRKNVKDCLRTIRLCGLVIGRFTPFILRYNPHALHK